MSSPFPPPPWIGSDESGKGDFFGPLVAAAVYADEGIARTLLSAGIKDCKLLTDEKVLALEHSIKKNCPHSVLELKPEAYNRLYAQFKAEKKNLNHLLAWAHSKAIEDVLSKKPCETVITDKFGDDKFMQSRLSPLISGKKIVLIQQPRAEENIAVAAASILARARLIQWSAAAEKEWGMKIPKGATHVKEPAKEFLKRFGREKLGLVAKLHFKTTDEI